MITKKTAISSVLSFPLAYTLLFTAMWWETASIQYAAHAAFTVTCVLFVAGFLITMALTLVAKRL